ncbi:MAG: hypothetical protein ABI400_03990 [Lacisediminihabitans sp.]
MNDVQQVEVAADEVQTSDRYRWPAVAVLAVAAVALVGAFIPLSTVAAGALATLGLIFGASLLVRDPKFNWRALAATLLSSAAVSAAVIMTFVYA